MLLRDFMVDEECENLLTCPPRDKYWDCGEAVICFIDNDGLPFASINKEGFFVQGEPPILFKTTT